MQQPPSLQVVDLASELFVVVFVCKRLLLVLEYDANHFPMYNNKLVHHHEVESEPRCVTGDFQHFSIYIPSAGLLPFIIKGGALVALRRGPNMYPFIVCTTTNQPRLIASYIWNVSLGKSCSLTAVKPKISNFRPRPCLLKLALSVVMTLNAAILRGSASGAAISHFL